jgi:hypothetical protein
MTCSLCVRVLLFVQRRHTHLITAESALHGICTGGGKNNGNNKKLRNKICVDYIERTSAGNTECSSVCLHSVVLVSVN